MKRIVVALLLMLPGASMAQTVDAPAAQSTPIPVIPKGPMHNCPAAQYPALAMRLNHQGVTVVEFTVGVDGQISDAHVSQSSGHDELDAAAVASTACLVYKPAMKDGQPVAMTWHTAVTWHL